MKRTQHVGKSKGKSKTKMRMYTTREAKRLQGKMVGFLLDKKVIIGFIKNLVKIEFLLFLKNLTE